MTYASTAWLTSDSSVVKVLLCSRLCMAPSQSVLARRTSISGLVVLFCSCFAGLYVAGRLWNVSRQLYYAVWTIPTPISLTKLCHCQPRPSSRRAARCIRISASYERQGLGCTLVQELELAAYQEKLVDVEMRNHQLQAKAVKQRKPVTEGGGCVPSLRVTPHLAPLGLCRVAISGAQCRLIALQSPLPLSRTCRL